MAARATKILSINLAGGTLFLHHLLAVERPDLLLAQEVLLSSKDLLLKVNPYGYSCESNVNALNPTKPGTAVIWREGVPVTETRVIVEGRLQSVTVGTVTFLNVYAPSGSAGRREREQLFSTELFHELTTAGQAGLPWLAGDWNSLVQENQTQHNYRDKRSPALSNILQNFNYTDVFSHLHPTAREFTFHRAGVAQSRLDRIYCPPGHENSLETAQHMAGLSDHSGVECRARLDVRARPRLPAIKTYWKLNTSILTDPRFLPQFRRLYGELRAEWEEQEQERKEQEEQEQEPPAPAPAAPAPGPDLDAVRWWEFVKPQMKNFCRAVSIELAEERRSTKKFLYTILKSATRRENWGLVAGTKEKIRTMLVKEVHGLVVRSRYQQNLEEEKAALFHQNKEVKMSRKAKLTKLKRPDSTVTQDEELIAEDCWNFFDALLNGRHDKNLQDTGQTFQPSLEHVPEFLAGLPTLSQESGEELVAPLQKEELKDALKQSQNGKSPGLDGLSYEFYSAVWEVVGDDFFSAMKEVLASATLPESDRHGVTRLIVKVDGTPKVTDLRPVTLLNCTYKLLSMVLVQRLNMVLPEVITSSQLAVPGRDIMSGGHNLVSTIQFINHDRRRGGFVASWDQVKAHDRATTWYLDRVLEAMHFPQVFRGWARMLHEGATTCLLAGPGGLTRRISVNFSFRQGDPAASPFYALQQEPFLKRVAVVCKGVTIGRGVTSYRQVDEAFCDDETIVGQDINDVIRFEEEMRKFESQSGAILSRTSKSKIMYIGNWAGRDDSPFPWLQVVKELKVFGLVLTPNYRTTLSKTWEGVLKGFRSTIYAWGERNLENMFQRAEVARTFAQSKLWYVSQVLPLPRTVAKKIESILSSFLFSGKPERLGLQELYNKPAKGGLGLLDVRKKADSLLLKQLTRMLLKDQEGAYRHLAFWLGAHLRHYLPALMARSAVLHTDPPPYHQYALDRLLDGFQMYGIKATDLAQVSSKTIYTDYISHTLPDPKITNKYLQVNFPGDVWPRLSYTTLTAGPRQAVFDGIHGLVRNRARLHEQGRVLDPWCQACPTVIPLLPPRSTQEHMFCSCVLVSEAWTHIKEIAARHQPELRGEEDKSIIRFLFPRDRMDEEVTWVLANYLDIAREQSIARGNKLQAPAVRGRLADRLKAAQTRAVGGLTVML